MTGRELLDQYFADLLGADVGRVRPGQIHVVRSAPREAPENGPGSGREARGRGNCELVIPVWILVARGRAVVSSSRFLCRAVESWAEDFAAPEYLLEPRFLEDLRREVAQFMDCGVGIARSRIFMPMQPASDLVLEMRPAHVAAASGAAIPRVLKRTRRRSEFPVFRCDVADHVSARAALERGCVEYGRSVRFEVRR